MASYRLHRETERRLEEIWDYTFENWGREQAGQYLLQIEAVCERLAKRPDTGIAWTLTDVEDVRFERVNRHLIFYVRDEPGIVVLTVLHERIDLPSRLAEALGTGEDQH